MPLVTPDAPDVALLYRRGAPGSAIFCQADVGTAGAGGTQVLAHLGGEEDPAGKIAMASTGRHEAWCVPKQSLRGNKCFMKDKLICMLLFLPDRCIRALPPRMPRMRGPRPLARVKRNDGLSRNGRCRRSFWGPVKLLPSDKLGAENQGDLIRKNPLAPSIVTTGDARIGGWPYSILIAHQRARCRKCPQARSMLIECPMGGVFACASPFGWSGLPLPRC